MAYHPIGFKDNNDFLISHETVCYNCPGTSYLDKFKNGLLFDDVLSAQARVEQMSELYTIQTHLEQYMIEENKNHETYSIISSEDKDQDEYEQWIDIEDAILSSKKKITRFKQSKRSKHLSKYNRTKLDRKWIRTSGFNDKQWIFSQETPFITGLSCRGCNECDYCIWAWIGMDEDYSNLYGNMSYVVDIIKKYSTEPKYLCHYLLDRYPTINEENDDFWDIVDDLYNQFRF
jgi:hypothetical protein